MIHLADILEQFLPDYDAHYSRSTEQYRVCSQIADCRTPIMGGFRLHCDKCEHDQWLYHACRNRHCPRCQKKASQEWEQTQLSHLVDTGYFHLVFTLPHELNLWARLHRRVIYNGLFQSVWDTLNTLGQDKNRLGGQLGMTAVLHTWGQNLSQHIHLHCLIPAGALNDQNQWHPAKSTYLFPVRVLSRLFRGKMVAALRKSYTLGQLHRITHPREINRILNTLMRKEWVVYAKHAIDHPETVVRYLARYTRKIAISESRLLAMDKKTVTFQYKDYRDHQNKQHILKGEEFVRRYLQHVFPLGFMRIRHYGWLSNSSRKKQLANVRKAIDDYASQNQHALQPLKYHGVKVIKRFDGIHCPHCKKAMMNIVQTLLPLKTIRQGFT
jgi:hypothetical protein